MKRMLILLAALGCGSADQGGIPAGQRLVTGRVFLESDGQVTQRRALQLVALYASATCDEGHIPVGEVAFGVAACAIFGQPFDPGEQGGGITSEPFRLELPCDRTVNLLVQTLSSSGGQTPGDLLAVLAFDDGSGALTTLLPRESPEDATLACRDTPRLATNLIDLGDLIVPAGDGDLVATVQVGGVEGGLNPLGTVDTDGDTIANLADTDDDEDDLIDGADEDDDGDGAADDAQRFSPDWL
jgi:hypothetical protein